MTCFLEKSTFIHIPKTGGNWVQQALKNAGILINSSSDIKHQPVSSLLPQQFTFAFVRNPWDWFRSWWGYRMTTNWQDVDVEIDISCRSDNFQEFVDRMLENIPGACCHSYQRFLGCNFDEVNFIGKTENLAEDLISALELSGEFNFDKQKIKDTPLINQTNYQNFPATYREDQILEIYNTEKEICSKFGFIPPNSLSSTRLLSTCFRPELKPRGARLD